MTINWTYTALEMLAEIHDYLSEFSVVSADKYISGLLEYLDKLKTFPEMCAPCRHPNFMEIGYRCCHFNRHIIYYEKDEEVINILAVIHEKKDPRMLNFEEPVVTYSHLWHYVK